MCLVVVLYRVVDGAPVLIAANREERYDRSALPPRVFRGPRTNTMKPRRAGHRRYSQPLAETSNGCRQGDG